MHRILLQLTIVALACGACRHAPAPVGAPPAPQTQKDVFKEAAMTQWQGQFSSALQGSYLVIQSEPEWRAAWALIGQSAPPAPDFQSRFAVAVFLGQRNTGGYGIRWLEPDSSGPATVVRYKVITPRGITMEVLTQPYAIKVFARGKVDIRLEVAPD